VDVAVRGEDALWMAGATDYDAIALDVQLPGIDGFEGCRRLRADGVQSPILMLSGRGGVKDRVAGLDGDADDYLVKPFCLEELAARLRALMRRGPVERATVIEVGDLRMNPATRRVWRGREEIALSAKEFALLVEFMRRPGRVLSRFLLLEPRVGRRVRKSLERRRRLRRLSQGQDRPVVRCPVVGDGARRRLSGARRLRDLGRAAIQAAA
jgi:two-component system OmpR family response regulator